MDERLVRLLRSRVVPAEVKCPLSTHSGRYSQAALRCLE
jgi:hypothetical protein